ncbi:hypothetical protein C5B42_02675 [Candidatus Cerribacteria bacterium 'Amazon FNV 2010 28 9']|uniref:Cytochrome b5 heme-binding domain-containing protein n=1 Tax=Candidatus Cerribacteria bacterium 'Amazon FNV 2010 28 9' TaxID=2081795 RepID=A0A317JNZ0_9BACT|nr:MAG: hypothetical protein C5B42_02675 [Candidatus Cerribacteria bacterium 'Amazon FNV 2010 28 9']
MWGIVLFQPYRVVYAQNLPSFTAADLAQYDGKDGHKAYFAYNGMVYDVTGNEQWTNGSHYGNLAGQDLTGKMAGAPHGEEVLKGLPVVGTYNVISASPLSSPTGTLSQASPLAQATKNASQPWYATPIRIAGLSLLAWSGIVLTVVFILNFATCFAMPWSQLPLPWKGKRPGPDPLDNTPVRLRWANLHKYFAWATVILGLVHGILGIMQLLGYFV